MAPAWPRGVGGGARGGQLGVEAEPFGKLSHIHAPDQRVAAAVPRLLFSESTFGLWALERIQGRSHNHAAGNLGNLGKVLQGHCKNPPPKTPNITPPGVIFGRPKWPPRGSVIFGGDYEMVTIASQMDAFNHFI
jgi:hypothetical protein